MIMDDVNHRTAGTLNGSNPGSTDLSPASLLKQFWRLFSQSGIEAPVIDLACGRGQNGIFLATKGIPVMLIDRSGAKLASARRAAKKIGVLIDTRQLDLEQSDSNPLPMASAGGIMVFRYLHRPLMPDIKNALIAGGILIYETYTRDQARYKRPKNPDYLLKSGELKHWFEGWEMLHYYEGTKKAPERAIAQIVCRKPALTSP